MGRKRLSAEVTAQRERDGAALQARRKQHGLTPSELAEALGISRPYLSNIEAGRRPITPDLTARITDVLGAEVAA